MTRTPTVPAGSCRNTALIVVVVMLLGGFAGCGATGRIDDPLAELREPLSFPSRQLAAMDKLDPIDTEPDEEYTRELHRLLWRPGYTVSVREAALNRLEQYDPEGLRRTIRQYLPRLTAWAWLTRLSEIIADRGWVELSPALVSSWARPSAFVTDERDRPEFKALARLYGEEQVPEIIFQMFLESRSVAEQGLRTRCWDLMHRLGYREDLIDLVTNSEVPTDDAMLIDLQAGARDFGIVPRNREEILWLRELRKPERAAFWSQARTALGGVSAERRRELELRDLPIIVAAHAHQPELLQRTNQALYDELAAYVRAQRHHDARSDFNHMRAGRSERLYEYRHDLTWGDLAAMLLAVRAFQVPQMVDHLFDYAERDRLDETTEYGGVINLDSQGRFEILEFPPRIRHHGNKFIAPQEMFEAGYTALFHFHNHAQRHHNAAYASPGYGDRQYADNTRANCLVFTFINENTLNMDFYRHGGVVIDLGEIRRRGR